MNSWNLHHRFFSICATFLCVAWSVLACGRAQADIFVLDNGGEIRGEWLNRSGTKVTSYEIKTANGKMTVPAGQVREVVRQKPNELEYEARAPQAADTIDGQWKLAEWCREQSLTRERQLHLRRILELDTNHAGARHGLGYQQIDGKWVTTAQFRDNSGYAFYQGRWRVAQEIELLEERRRLEQAEKEFTAKLRRWRDGLAGEKSGEFREKFVTLTEGAAVPGLVDLLRIERYRDAKLIYVEALGHIGTGPSVAALVRTSLEDPDVEMFYACEDELVRHKFPKVAAAYVQMLKDNNNVKVNRAAHILGRLEDRTAVEPLIEALLTTHRVVHAPPNGSSPDSISTSFGSRNDGVGNISPETSFTTGNKGKVENVEAQNQEVLKSLAKLTGGTSFGFDKPAWRKWYASQKNNLAEKVDVRRDAN